MIYLISFSKQLPFFPCESGHFISDLCAICLKTLHSTDNHCESMKTAKNVELGDPVRPNLTQPQGRHDKRCDNLDT
jgi:hypothetical protein